MAEMGEIQKGGHFVARALLDPPSDLKTTLIPDLEAMAAAVMPSTTFTDVREFIEVLKEQRVVRLS
jgi:hypothetical protein